MRGLLMTLNCMRIAIQLKPSTASAKKGYGTPVRSHTDGFWTEGIRFAYRVNLYEYELAIKVP